jgi:hypothetical protein
VKLIIFSGVPSQATIHLERVLVVIARNPEKITTSNIHFIILWIAKLEKFSRRHHKIGGLCVPPDKMEGKDAASALTVQCNCGELAMEELYSSSKASNIWAMMMSTLCDYFCQNTLCKILKSEQNVK